MYYVVSDLEQLINCTYLPHSLILLLRRQPQRPQDAGVPPWLQNGPAEDDPQDNNANVDGPAEDGP
jgi:hypothetical protein